MTSTVESALYIILCWNYSEKVFDASKRFRWSIHLSDHKLNETLTLKVKLAKYEENFCKQVETWKWGRTCTYYNWLGWIDFPKISNHPMSCVARRSNACGIITFSFPLLSSTAVPHWLLKFRFLNWLAVLKSVELNDATTLVSSGNIWHRMLIWKLVTPIHPNYYIKCIRLVA